MVTKSILNISTVCVASCYNTTELANSAIRKELAGLCAAPAAPLFIFPAIKPNPSWIIPAYSAALLYIPICFRGGLKQNAVLSNPHPFLPLQTTFR